MQPSGQYARWADSVDHFTHYGMTRKEALKVCQEEYDLGPHAAKEKVTRAELEPGRYADCLYTIGLIHGKAEQERTEREIR